MALIDCAANNNSHRDRDDLDLAVARLLQQFLDADAVTLYHLIDHSDTKRVRRAAAVTRCNDSRGLAAAENLPELISCNNVAAWRECIAGQKAVQYATERGKLCTTFPIANERAVVGMLEIESDAGLQLRDSGLVEGILHIVKNHLALLEHGERDKLTGLLNRKSFESHFDKLRVTRAVAIGDEPSWLGIVDIDRFKSINDTYGQVFGDEVLLLVARLLKQAFRGADQLFRFGGEEFVVVLDRATQAGAQIAFNRLRSRIAEFHFPQVGQVTVSLGYTQVDPSDDPSNCVERADAALYYAKEHGRNNIQKYEALLASGHVRPKHSGADDIEAF